MVTVIALRETGYFDFELGHVSEESLWLQMCSAFKVDKFFLVPKIGNAVFDKYQTIQEAIKDATGKKVFLEEEKRAIEIGRKPIYLRDFSHPADVVYIFGCSGQDTSKWVTKDDELISVKVPQHTDMFGVSVASMVLYDREVKHGKR